MRCSDSTSPSGVGLWGDAQHGLLDVLIVGRKETHNGQEQRPALSRTAGAPHSGAYLELVSARVAYEPRG